MIINETILLNKLEEGNDKVFNYLLDNAENDLEADAILNLQSQFLFEGISENEYITRRNKLIEVLTGIKIK